MTASATAWPPRPSWVSCAARAARCCWNTPVLPPRCRPLDRFAARLPGARCTTAFCAVLSPDTGELVYSSAGHPPPIVVLRRPHHARCSTALSATPLGLAYDRARPEARDDHAAARHAAALHRRTGGAPSRSARRRHRPRRRCGAGQRRHRRWTTWPSEIMSRLAPSGGYQDDVALLLYRQPAPLEMEFPPMSEQLASSPGRPARVVDPGRGRTRPDAGRADRDRRGAGQRHRARPPARDAGGHGRFGDLRATALADRLHVTVVDTGSWKTAGRRRASRSGHRAHAGLMHDVTIEPRCRRHHRSHAREDRLMATPLSLTTDSRDDGSLVLRATGEIDLSNVDAFAEASANARKRGSGRRTLTRRSQRRGVPGQRRPSTCCSTMPTAFRSSSTRSSCPS